jgi:hypothetical protein
MPTSSSASRPCVNLRDLETRASAHQDRPHPGFAVAAGAVGHLQLARSPTAPPFHPDGAQAHPGADSPHPSLRHLAASLSTSTATPRFRLRLRRRRVQPSTAALGRRPGEELAGRYVVLLIAVSRSHRGQPQLRHIMGLEENALGLPRAPSSRHHSSHLLLRRFTSPARSRASSARCRGYRVRASSADSHLENLRPPASSPQLAVVVSH